MPTKGQETPVEDRLWAKTIIQGDCRIWTGKMVGKGYGAIWYRGKMVRIGRLICHLWWEANLDDDSWVAAHKPECPNKNCWNPLHLYVTTQYQNVQDQIAAGTFKDGRANLNGGKNFSKKAWMSVRSIK